MQLRQREEELHLTFQNAPTPILTIDTEGKVLSANRAWCAMLGYTEAELREMALRDLTHPDDIERSAELIDQAVRGERTTYTLKKRYLRKDGTVVYTVLHTGVVHDADGRPLMLVGQIEDLTQRLKAEEEASEHRERLAHVDRLNVMGEMAASIAHEINQPLTAIANRSSAAQRRIAAGNVDPAKLLDSLKKVNEQAQRAGDVVRRLRNLVKKRDSERELTDLNEMVRESISLAGVDARIHDLSVDLSLTEPLPSVVADPIQIQQVILNLLRNAIDAMEGSSPHVREIAVSTAPHDTEFVEVAVADRGSGISEDTEAQLFQPFFTTKASGMGMGLSISRSIITAHGGRFWFTRNPGQGTTFRFTLPIAIGEDYE